MKRASVVAVLAGMLAPLVLAGLAQAQVRVEYIAHACFVVESPAGVRVVLDPYNGKRWLGYSFPDSIKADLVLITHPHYDHDASYYFSPDAPALRMRGKYKVGDVRLLGVRGKHADPYGRDFGQLNTLWVIETGGLRIAHLGDNGPLTEANLRALGRVDVLMIPIDGQDHILTRGQIEAILATLAPRVVIPMHYQIPSLWSLPRSLGPIEPWLAGRDDVRRLGYHRAVFTPDSLPTETLIVVFPPSPGVNPWPASLKQAWAELDQARALLQQDTEAARNQAVVQLRRATELAPGAIRFWWELGKALGARGKIEEAVRVLERGLATASRDDWEYTEGARATLAELYKAAGQPALAAAQYRLILATSYRTELRRLAEEFLQANQGHEPH
ncbi:MAG: MBL fold metallo-hydrolase [Terriglobia bacterium]